MRRLVITLAAFTLALTVLVAAPTAAQAKPRIVRCHAAQWIDNTHGQQQCYRRYPHHPWADGWYWKAWGPTWWWGWYGTPYWWLV